MLIFSEFFRQPDRPGRDKYLSRLFGIFSEEVVRAWCTLPTARYEDIGRPYLKRKHETRGHTLVPCLAIDTTKFGSHGQSIGMQPGLNRRQ